MGMKNFLFTSESITEGHPDKVADQISDNILDHVLAQDPQGRVACETLVTTGMAMIAGEITTSCWVDMPDVVRQTVREIGYDDPRMGFDWKTIAVLTSIDKQSPDIAMGVDTDPNHEQGAGDQGLMFGYACKDTPVLMPAPIHYAHRLTEGMARARKEGVLPWLRPDGKSQVSMEYQDGKPVRIDTIVLAAQHDPEVSLEDIREGLIEEVVKKVLPADLMNNDIHFHINATGRFVMGGPQADCGLTGRKIIADTYGGQGSHGGGAFSGKDPSKVDRSASYMGRYVAKNVVAADLADTCEVQIAYAIGVAEPVSVMINTFGTSKVSPDRIAELVREVFPLKPAAMIAHLDLLRPIYRKTAAYGHFGRELPEFTWERCDMVEALKAKAF